MPKTRVTIEWDQATGKLDMGGPLQNKVLMYGVLMAAMDTVRKWHDEHATQVKQAAPEEVSALVGVNGGKV